VQHQAAHRIGGPAAVGVQIFPGVVAGHGLVLHESADQVLERFGGEIVTNGRFAQRHEHGMGGRAAVHGFQFPAPPIKKPQALGGVVDLVTEVVGPTAEGVEVEEVLVEPPG
jgi:hypothetical protein